MAYEDWQKQNKPSSFETWKAESVDPPISGGGFAEEFGKGLIDAYLLGGKGALGTAEMIATRKTTAMIPSLGYQQIGPGLPREHAIPTALRTGQQRIEAAREPFQMTHAGVSAKAGRILGNAIGYMSQSMAMGYVAGPVGAAMIGFNIEGQSAYDDAIASGATEEQAQRERLIVGSINAGIEALQISRLMKFHKAGKHSLKNFIRLAKQRAYKRMLQTGKQFGADILRHSIEEGLEEFAQEGVSVSVPALFRGEYPKKEDGTIDVWALGERLGGAAVGGAFAGGVLGTAGQVRLGGKETLAGAAIRLKSGEILTGKTHVDILRNVKAQGRTITNKEFDVPAGSGFITNEGRFVSPKESWDIAEEAGQLKEDMKSEFRKRKHLVAESVSFRSRTPKVSESIPEALDEQELNMYGHAIPEALGMQKEERQTYNEALIGKRSMADMTPQEKEDLMWQFRQDADAAGIDLNKLAQKFQPLKELNKQLQSLKRYKKPLGELAERRRSGILKAANWVGAKVESYLLRQDRMKNLTRMLDGYKEDGPMSRLIFEPIKAATVKAKDSANMLMYNLRRSAQERGIDIGKMFDQKPLLMGKATKAVKPHKSLSERRDALKVENPNMTTPEAMEIIHKENREILSNLNNTLELGDIVEVEDEGQTRRFVTFSRDGVKFLAEVDKNNKTKHRVDSEVKLTDGTALGVLEKGATITGEKLTVFGTSIFETKIAPTVKPGVVGIATEGKEILLSDSEMVGIYYLAQNPKARINIEAMFKKDGIDPKAAIETINDYVEKNDDLMYVYRDARAYFDQMGPRFFDVVEQLDIKGVVPEQNYITMLLNKGDEEGTADILAEMTQQFGLPLPGKKHTKERTGAVRTMNMDIFSIVAQASRSLERFINVAPVISKVNKLIEKPSFKENLNATTKGQGVKIFKKWLADSARGRSDVNMDSINRTATWLRRNAVLYTLGAKIFTVVPKQAISLHNAVAKRPAMLPVVLKTLNVMADPRVSKQLEERAVNKSKLVKNRDWERDLRKVWTTKDIKKFFKGKKLSPLSMRSITWMDRKTVTVVWNSAYDLALADGLEENQARKYADDMVETTQPMADTTDLPDFFRGGPVAKALTTFMNQRNQNWQFLRHDILGEYRAGKVGKGMAMYRFLFSQILPSMMLGMITRGRLPKDAKEMALDLGSYIVTPQIFLGRFLWNMATGDWRSDTSAAVSMLPLKGFEEVSRAADALQRGDIRTAAERGVGAVGAFTGKIPQQVITTTGGVIDLAIGETDDYKRLIYSEYMIKKYGEKKKEGLWE
jgi:hypothetical protein